MSESTIHESTNVENSKFGLENLLCSFKGEKIDLSYMIYKFLKENNEQNIPTLLKHICGKFDLTQSSEELPIDVKVHASEKQRLEKQYGEIIDAMFKSLLEKNSSEIEFYKEMWKLIENPFFIFDDDNDKAHAFALYYILIDRRIPYFQLETGLRMTNHEVRKRYEKLSEKMNKIRFILATNFSQKTEESSLLLKEIKSEEDEADQIVLLMYLIDLFRQQEKRLRQQINN